MLSPVGMMAHRTPGMYTHTLSLSNVISLSKLPALTGTNISVHMITSRAAAVQTVYHVDQVPDRFLMRFWKRMLFGEMTELIVLQTFRQSLGNTDTDKLDVFSNLILISHWLPCCADDVVYMRTFMGFWFCLQTPDIYADWLFTWERLIPYLMTIQRS